MKFSYETIGSQNYLVATFEGGEGLINYQMQMLVNNEIKNILPTTKRQMNDDILLSYNISSKVSLADLDETRKISKLGIIHIVEGALDALNDVEEYQLASSGIVFDEKYIYVKPDTFEPSFVYLPCYTDDCGVNTLKNLLLSLVMGSKVEITTDTFVQTLLETLNSPTLSAEGLKAFCEKFKSGAASQPKHDTSPKPTPVNLPASTSAPVRNEVFKPEADSSARIISVQPQKTAMPSAKNTTVKAAKSDKKKEKASGGKTMLFIVLQVVFAALAALLYLSGMLNDESGKLVVEYMLGVVLGIAAADFIIYREMFVNNKEKNTSKDNKKNSGKNDKKAKASKQTKSVRPTVAVPGKEPVSVPGREMPVMQKADFSAKASAPISAPAAAPAPAFVPPVSSGVSAPAYNPDEDFGSEATVLLDANAGYGAAAKEAYLEYYDKAKGKTSRLVLNKPAIVVGKLAGQCDCVLSDQTISKVHAEFITRNGEYFVKDYNSTNGTYINGSEERIVSNTEYPIHNGDTITLAGVEMTFNA